LHVHLVDEHETASRALNDVDEVDVTRHAVPHLVIGRVFCAT
jgi:hypothetical protein